jgi:hypothetical protein
VVGALCDDAVADSLDFVQCYNRSLLLFPMRSCSMLVFALVIDAGVGVGVVCAVVFTFHPTRSGVVADDTETVAVAVVDVVVATLAVVLLIAAVVVVIAG